MSFDVDIDVSGSFDPVAVFGDDVVKASIYGNKKLTPHPCGVYFQTVPTDPLTGLAAVPYDVAAELGCFKVDFLHLRVYDHFTSREEIKTLVRTEPDWTLLEIPSVVKQLFQVSKHYDLIAEVRPRSVLELADCLALIRPQKRFLLGTYLKDRVGTRPLLYKIEPGGDGYAFKKAHAVAYALVIVLELHLIKAGIKLEDVP